MTLEVSNIPGLPPCTILRAPMLNPSLLEPTQAGAFSAAPESGWEPCMGPALLATGHGVSPGLGGSEPCPSLACVPRAWPVSPEPSPYHPAAPVPRQSPLPHPVGHTALSAAQDVDGSLGWECSLLCHVELLINRHSQVLVLGSILYPFSAHSLYFSWDHSDPGAGHLPLGRVEL